MSTLLVNLLCAVVVLGAAGESSVIHECCKKIEGFKDCRRQCEKVWVERKPAKKLQLALSLPRVCPSHLDFVWSCFSSSLQGLHLYKPLNSSLNGKSCCLLAIGTSCRNACFLSSNLSSVQKICPEKEEESLLRCIGRNAGSEKCCKTSSSRCKKACQIVFSSEKKPSKRKIRTVKKKCKKSNTYVSTCVDKLTGSKPRFPDHRCCKMTSTKTCQAMCREVMASKKPGEEKMGLLRKGCANHLFHHAIWSCFLTYAVYAGPTVGVEKRPEYKADVRLHCCLRANTEVCLKLCLKGYSEGGIAATRMFHRVCEFNPVETTLMTCIADVTEPCHIGCSGLGFCTNFNHRHTEHFRKCNREADVFAKYDFESWWKKGRVKITAMDVIPVKDIKKCLPEMWKAVACVLQIKPCQVKSHSSVICRKDCLKILHECAKIQQLGVRTVEMICEGLSPDDQSSCISLDSYIKPSFYKKDTDEVTHPCYPNPCEDNDVCEINRDLIGLNSSAFTCTPGCPIDVQSKLLIKDGDFARLPIVQDSKLEGCFKICRCDQKRLSDCPRLPNCVERKPCHIRGTKESYKHQEKFFINCNFCVCFDGEVTCSKKQCLPAYNATGRPRRNHSPKDDEYEISGLPCRCVPDYTPVCGSNGKTYRNLCLALCASLSKDQISVGACAITAPCNPSPCEKGEHCIIDRKICIGTQAFCPQYICAPKLTGCYNATTELLCDEENRQHYNRCSLHLNNNELAYHGLCEESCSPGKQLVCGIDGRTYNSHCALKHARMLMDYEGHCITVGSYTSQGSTEGCEEVKCRGLKPKNCVGVTPPGACCPICATQLVVLFSEDEIFKTNEIVMDKTKPITQGQVVSRVRRHLSVSECDLFGFYSTYGDFVLLVKTITENPTTLQFLICNKEAQKIETLIHTASPVFTSDEILSSFRAVSLTEPKLMEQRSSAYTTTHVISKLLFLLPFSLTFVHAWPR